MWISFGTYSLKSIIKIKLNARPICDSVCSQSMKLCVQKGCAWWAKPSQARRNAISKYIESNSSNPFECTLLADIELLRNFHWRTESKTERKKSMISFTLHSLRAVLCAFCAIESTWQCVSGMARKTKENNENASHRGIDSDRDVIAKLELCASCHFFSNCLFRYFSSFFSFTVAKWYMHRACPFCFSPLLISLFIVCLSSPFALTFSFLSANCYFSMASFLIVLETIALMCIETSEIHCWCSHTWHRWTVQAHWVNGFWWMHLWYGYRFHNGGCNVQSLRFVFG